MSYQVLARKWRPQVFADVVGQEHITRTIQNAIATNRLAHAFLFSGPRGVGKTTTARILAKALNCRQGPTPEPCGKCDPCRETAAGTSVDVIEIDGASNRGIEHIRELREAVKYAPAGGKYKVYVIDEVHMLTNEAFNALLKTLEEPPPHVIFIFATTEPQKVPATIQSRCQRYSFKRISIQDLVKKLGEIAATEGIVVSPAGLGMIARAAEGSMRDGQSLLDQAVSYSGMNVKDEDLMTLLGAVPQQALVSFADRLIAKDASSLLAHVDRMIEQGQDIRQFLQAVVGHVRNLFVAKIAQDPGKIIELPQEDVEAVRKQAEAVDTEQLVMLFDSLSRTLDEMRWSQQQRFTLEAGLIKACSIRPLKPLSELLARLQVLEARLGQGLQGAGVFMERQAGYGTARSTKTPDAEAQSRDIEQLWADILSSLKQKKPALHSALRNSRPVSLTRTELSIVLSGTNFEREQAGKREHKELIARIASELLNREVSVRIDDAGPGAAAPKPKTHRRAPTKQDHPAVIEALRIFGGEVVENEPEE